MKDLITLRNIGKQHIIVEINGKEVIREFYVSGESEINHTYHWDRQDAQEPKDARVIEGLDEAIMWKKQGSITVLEFQNKFGRYPGEVLDEAARAYQSISAGQGVAWQPIETAPKDGSWFLAFNEEGDVRKIHDTTYTEGSPGYADGLRDHWWEYITDDNFCMPFRNAIGWQPLPASPATKSKPSGRG